MLCIYYNFTLKISNKWEINKNDRKLYTFIKS